MRANYRNIRLSFGAAILFLIVVRLACHVTGVEATDGNQIVIAALGWLMGYAALRS